MEVSFANVVKTIAAQIAKLEFIGATNQDTADLALKGYSQALGAAAAEALAPQNATYGPTALATIQGTEISQIVTAAGAIASASTNPTIQQAGNLLSVLSSLGL
jgi:hypothetical protein